MLLGAGIWIALAANTFLSQFEDAFAAIDEKEIQVDGRWTWEATLLFGGGEDIFEFFFWICLEVAKACLKVFWGSIYGNSLDSNWRCRQFIR